MSAYYKVENFLPSTNKEIKLRSPVAIANQNIESAFCEAQKKIGNDFPLASSKKSW
ncbi:hypothetical protein [Okeania sp. SIO2B3]|uniref:hypothetical protein n=1 Tax=Okeania sp. SIO2B3 TaxID=2607784 RepID=UPI0013BF4CA1|nr:hypothetical protein [Okeania sp. SIO2B3]NET43785.1 hypothetical protein [Okeania sp. SIO2B3]